MPNFNIAVTSRQRKLRIDRRRLIRMARSVLRQEQVAAAQISVAILDDPQIQAINRQFLNHDSPTDVISFLLDCNLVEIRSPGELTSRRRRGAAKMIEGEVVISAETAAGNAGKYGISLRDELALDLVHGLLHLCGYDDQTPKEKRLMRRREAEALARFDIVLPRRPSKGK